eukprot:SM000011S19048  [mRNA]  locus=s11:571186:575936:- [translate_table: standard]
MAQLPRTSPAISCTRQEQPSLRLGRRRRLCRRCCVAAVAAAAMLGPLRRWRLLRLCTQIFSTLGRRDLCSAAAVCRQWAAVSRHPDFWRSLAFTGPQLAQPTVFRLCRRYGAHVVSLALRGNGSSRAAADGPGGDALLVQTLLLRQAAPELPALRELALAACELGRLLCKALPTPKFASLTSLSIHEVFWGPPEVAIEHATLSALRITSCCALRITIKCPMLETLSLRKNTATSLSLACPALWTLDLASCPKLADSAVREAATSCPLLRTLNVSGCPNLSDDTLHDVGAACTGLVHLDASHCPLLSLEDVRLPALVEARLEGCEAIGTEAVEALNHSGALELLCLDRCWLLGTVALSLPMLASLSLAHCRKLQALTLVVPVLTSLALTSCPFLASVSIKSLALQTLALRAQPRLCSLELDCPGLLSANLSECDMLPDAALTTFSSESHASAGGCPRLLSLLLDACETLQEVKLCCSSLRSLSLAGCSSLEALALTCPVLRHLQLEGCDRLAAASLDPVGLVELSLGICPHLVTLRLCASSLASLDLKGCGGLRKLELTCPALTTLDASYCSQLDDASLADVARSSPRLSTLVLAACPVFRSQGLFALRALAELTTLDLSYTFLTALAPILTCCPKLQAMLVLRLSACKYLEQDALAPLCQVASSSSRSDSSGNGGLPPLCSLRELDASYSSLRAPALEELLRSCPRLTHVSLNGSPHVADSLWACISSYGSGSGSGSASSGWGLRWLSCVGCHGLRSVRITPGATCGRLAALNIALAANLRSVQLACPSLVSLTLSKCMALEVLELNCPRLNSLLLQGCALEGSTLECALAGCSMLETLDVRNCAKEKPIHEDLNSEGFVEGAGPQTAVLKAGVGRCDVLNDIVDVAALAAGGLGPELDHVNKCAPFEAYGASENPRVAAQ